MRIMNPSIQFDIPEYCEFYKTLLVEDLSFIHHPSLLHYGKCSIIGYIYQDEFSYYRLKSLTIPGVPKDFQLPDGYSNVLLDLNNYIENHKIPIDCYVEVFGEAVLCDKDQEADALTICSAKELIIELCDKQLNLEKSKGFPLRKPTGMSDKTLNSTVQLSLQKLLDEMQTKYIPAVKVHNVNVIDHAKELLLCNLKLKRVISNKSN